MNITPNYVDGLNIEANFDQLKVKFDADREVLWTFLNQQSRVPNANSDLMNDLFQHHEDIKQSNGYVLVNNESRKFKYSVLASKTEGYYSMGGDLTLMVDAAISKDRARLVAYATHWVEVIAQRAFNFGINDLVTISLVQGVNMGAGIEAMLTSDVVIAERKSTFMFPETHFNMFPGMGAYSFISRRASTTVADRMITSGKTYSAEDCYQLGLVDVLVEDGEGELAVYKYIERQKNSFVGFLSMQKAKRFVNPLTREELFSIVNVWVENALNLTERDFKMMERFIGSQRKLFNSASVTPITKPETNAHVEYVGDNVFKIAG